MMKLVISNLKQRPTRTAISMLAVSLGVVLILVSVGLTYGQLNDSADRTRRIGGDIMIQPPNSSLFFALNSGTMPARIADVVREMNGVADVTPILVKFLSERFHVVFGIDKQSFQRVNTNLRFVDGTIFSAPWEAIIDTNYAYANQLKVGDRLDILDHDFRITGIFEQGTAARVLIPLDTLQELNGTPDKVTMFFVRIGEGRTVDQVHGLLMERLTHYNITKTADIQQIMADNTPVFKQFLTAVVTLSVLISFLIILLAMYSTITERTREIGILKSLGASKSYIIRLVMEESLLICGLGVALGFALTGVALQLISVTFPSMPIAIPASWKVYAAVMAIGGGALGAFYPAMKAARLDPVRALGYE